MTDRSSAAPLLRAAGLRVKRGARVAIDGVSLTMKVGEVVSVVGPNGSGKTTLLHAVLGLAAPERGTVELGGRAVLRTPAAERARVAAYVPQRLEQSPGFLVRDVIETGRFAARHTREDPTGIDALIAACGLTALAERRFDTLSGGERQKVLLAAALAQRPRLLCLDEPSTALDPTYQVELVRILRSCNEGGCALLVVSHDLNLPLALGGRAVMLREGRIASEGAVADVIRPDRLSQVYQCEFVSLSVSGGVRLVAPAWWEGGVSSTRSTPT